MHHTGCRARTALYTSSVKKKRGKGRKGREPSPLKKKGSVEVWKGKRDRFKSGALDLTAHKGHTTALLLRKLSLQLQLSDVYALPANLCMDLEGEKRKEKERKRKKREISNEYTNT